VRQWSPDVTLLPHTDTLVPEQREQLQARGIQIAGGTVARLVVPNDQLQGVELGDGTLIPRTAVFVRPRFVANADLLTGLGCVVDEHGWVVHDPLGRTSVAGVWVAGNAADPRAQVITAAGQGQPRPSPSTPTWSTRTSSTPSPITAPATRHGQPDQGNAPRRSHEPKAPTPKGPHAAPSIGNNG
jgi:hypothetical protein